MWWKLGVPPVFKTESSRSGNMLPRFLVQLRCCKERKTALIGCFSHFRVTGSTSWNFTPLFLAELQYVAILNRSFTQPIWFHRFNRHCSQLRWRRGEDRNMLTKCSNPDHCSNWFPNLSKDTWFSWFLSSQSAHLFPSALRMSQVSGLSLAILRHNLRFSASSSTVSRVLSSSVPSEIIPPSPWLIKHLMFQDFQVHVHHNPLNTGCNTEDECWILHVMNVPGAFE